MAAVRKVCKKCRIFVEGDACPLCNGNQFSDAWKGRIMVFKPEESEIAKKMNLGKKGLYAIKTK
jgi:DNA-directed RNA polymerase subunit E"